MSGKTTVLVADDSETVREHVIEALAGDRFNVIEAIDGVEALQAVYAGGLSCIITDLNMPRMSGTELMREIGKDARYSNLPILVLSIEGAIDQIERAKQAGAWAWIVKPFKAETLRKAVAALIEKSMTVGHH